MLLSAVTMNFSSSMNQKSFVKPSKRGSYLATVSTGCGKPIFVLTAHYDISITSQPAKNI